MQFLNCKITLSFSNQKIKDRSETLINKGKYEVKIKFIVSLICDHYNFFYFLYFCGTYNITLQPSCREIAVPLHSETINNAKIWHIYMNIITTIVALTSIITVIITTTKVMNIIMSTL